MRRRRRELFPPDRGLQARMLLAMAFAPVIGIGGTWFALTALEGFQLYAFIFFAVCGVLACAGELVVAGEGDPLASGDEPELWAIVDRLCVAADLPRPEVVVDADREPNSWVVDRPRRAPRLHVTRGLLDLLEPVELEAVVAHELAHVAHRDATVMTVVGLPCDALSRAPFSGGAGAMIGATVGAVGRIGTASLSRHRELTADRDAAALTGRPSALASALLKVSGALAKVPDEDLREVGWQSLNLLPTGGGRLARWRPWRTHPSVEKRVAALERVERGMVTARAAPLGE